LRGARSGARAAPRARHAAARARRGASFFALPPNPSASRPALPPHPPNPSPTPTQAAETAWAQDEDLYGTNGYALASALELHARIVNAWLDGDETALPAGFRFQKSMPAAPAGCAWQFSIADQKWTAYNKTAAGQVCTVLADGFKYLLGITYLPTGFEVGYNHYVGRLGMKMPELAGLLSRNPVDWYTFSWGLGTLTHADTAKDTWRRGLTSKTLCKKSGRRRRRAG
jgi:hypothetical protein